MADNPAQPETPQGPRPVQIHMEEAIALGKYSNMAVVRSTETEFVVDFLYLQPQEPKGNVLFRAIMTPRHAKALCQALKDQVANYEGKMGEIPMPPASSPNGVVIQ